MALADYTPSLAWFADSLSDTDIPTGSTKSTPSGLSDPTITGSPDAYADFGLTHGVTFTTPTPVGEVGLGDITIVMKAQLDTSTAGRVIAENWDGSGVGNDACGWQIVNNTGTSRRIALAALPTEAGTANVECASNSHTLGSPFIIAFRRSSGTWTVWMDSDASGGMTSNTPATNNLGSNDVFSEMNPVTFGSRSTGANPFDGRIYWLVQINAAVSDADIQLAAWDTESNLKTAWLSAGGGTANLLAGKLGGLFRGKLG